MAELLGGKWLFGVGEVTDNMMTSADLASDHVRGPGHRSLHPSHPYCGPHQPQPPLRGQGRGGPGRGRHLPRNVGHDRPVVRTRGEKQVTSDTLTKDVINSSLSEIRFTAFSFAGGSFGTVVSLPLSGVLCETLGWESVFYVFGALGVLWFIVWALLVYNGPEFHPRISTEEREYLKVSDGFFSRPLP